MSKLAAWIMVAALLGAIAVGIVVRNSGRNRYDLLVWASHRLRHPLQAAGIDPLAQALERGQHDWILRAHDHRVETGEYGRVRLALPTGQAAGEAIAGFSEYCRTNQLGVRFTRGQQVATGWVYTIYFFPPDPAPVESFVRAHDLTVIELAPAPARH